VDRLFIKEASVGKAITMRRFRPRARGRTGRIRKPFSHLTVIVSERQEAV
jgi:large subunit ribosomal protein L22